MNTVQKFLTAAFTMALAMPALASSVSCAGNGGTLTITGDDVKIAEITIPKEFMTGGQEALQARFSVVKTSDNFGKQKCRKSTGGTIQCYEQAKYVGTINGVTLNLDVVRQTRVKSEIFATLESHSETLNLYNSISGCQIDE